MAMTLFTGWLLGVWTSDIGRALRMSEKLKAGTVWVNTYRAVSFTSPFGGYKRSGEGRESGKESIKEFLQVKSVWIAQQTTAANPIYYALIFIMPNHMLA